MMRIGFSVFIATLLTTAWGWAQPTLPISINIVSGIPLTLPEHALESMGLKPHENTGGWGDVMSNVGMALELKKQFPEINVRLLVTLNDYEQRQYVHKVREFIPQVLKSDRGEIYLNPDSKDKQIYRGVEIYFVPVDGSSAFAQPESLKPSEKAKLLATVAHIPEADLALQFSANDSSFSPLIVKAQKLYLYFEEYSNKSQSLAYAFFQNNRKQLKLSAGPLGFGVYGFGSAGDAHGSADNKKYLKSWLATIEKENPALQTLHLNSAPFDLAFAYAGDAEMIEDYIKAVQRISKETTDRPTVIVYKGRGPIKIKGRQVLIPLGAHPKELGHALISESTYSPLVTGDGSLSSALETTANTKSFLYENVEWKRLAMEALVVKVFAKDRSLQDAALNSLIPQTMALKDLKLSRKKRVTMMQTALLNAEVHRQWSAYFSEQRAALNIADNVINMYQFVEIFDSLKKGFQKGFMFSDDYMSWLTELAKTFSAAQGIPVDKLYRELNDMVYGKSKNLIEKWYAIFTLWEIGHTVANDDVVRIISETADFLKQKKTTAYFESSMKLFGVLEQFNSSEKSKYFIYTAIKSNNVASKNFSDIRKAFDEQSSKPFRLSRKSSCEFFYAR